MELLSPVRLEDAILLLGFPSALIMPSPTRLKRSLISNKPSGSQQKPTDVRLSPEASSPEKKLRPSEPYPIPSNNPASQYTLLEKLGTGSFGTVYKAIHNETKQIVAVKQIGNGVVSAFPAWV